MGTFREAYDGLTNYIEKRYEIRLTLGEKILLKNCLNYSQEILMRRNFNGQFGMTQMNEAKEMWLKQYGIGGKELEIFYNTPRFFDYIRKRREEQILL